LKHIRQIETPLDQPDKKFKSRKDYRYADQTRTARHPDRRHRHPLSAVSGTLSRGYELAAHEVANAPAGPMQNVAKAKMTELATQILREAAGNLALKISPRSYGARGFYEAYNRTA
jgi:hypothetical protein